jgi:hypothetical protein
MHNLKFSRVNTQIFVDSVEARVVATEAVVAGLPRAAPDPLEESHGTINILLANQNGLVAVTDSMLSTPDDHHYPGHQKLFRIDDKTIATMAGSYSKPGMGGRSPNFDLWVPNIMNGFSVRLQRSQLRTLVPDEVRTIQRRVCASTHCESASGSLR